MAACPQCGGFGRVPAKQPSGCLAYVDCPCLSTATPGRIPHPHQIHYPAPVLTALRQAGEAQNAALQVRGTMQQARSGGG